MRRKVRIAFSVVCGIVCVLLIVLWVRSYWRLDTVVCGIAPEKVVIVRSTMSAAVVEFMDCSGSGLNVVLFKWSVGSTPLEDDSRFKFGGVDNTYAGFLLQRSSGPKRFVFCMPYWFLAPACAALSAALIKMRAFQRSLQPAKFPCD